MEDFKSFLSNLGYRFFEHGVTGYRTPLGDHVYTASDDPPEVTMEPHNECSYSPFFPKKVHVKVSRGFIKGQGPISQRSRNVFAPGKPYQILCKKFQAYIPLSLNTN